jgi:hypothetical protein
MGKILKKADAFFDPAAQLFGGGKEGKISAALDPANFRDKITGKSEKEAGKAKEKAALDAAGIIQQGKDEAREDIFRLFPQAQQSLQQGFQGALDTFGQTVPQQVQQFQGGNIAAQEQIARGMPQFQNAILGGQVDYSGFQPYQAPAPDLSYTQQQLPQQQAYNPFQWPQQDGVGPREPYQPQQPQQPNPLTGVGPSFFNNTFNRV